MSKVLYICDRRACKSCSYPTCKHTTDITHAEHFSLGMDNETFVELEDTMKRKFRVHELDNKQQEVSSNIREVASLLDEALDDIRDCREASIAKTKLEECVMWANKAIALEGIK